MSQASGHTCGASHCHNTALALCKGDAFSIPFLHTLYEGGKSHLLEDTEKKLSSKAAPRHTECLQGTPLRPCRPDGNSAVSPYPQHWGRKKPFLAQIGEEARATCIHGEFLVAIRTMGMPCLKSKGRLQASKVSIFLWGKVGNCLIYRSTLSFLSHMAQMVWNLVSSLGWPWTPDPSTLWLQLHTARSSHSSALS